MPSRRAVLMTRQAISPRLAIRILENIRRPTSACAWRGRRSCLRAPPRSTHWSATCSPIRSATPRDRAASSRSRVISFLTSVCTEGAPSFSSAASAATVGVERIVLDDLVDQADAQRRRRIEHAAVHQELARHARAHRLDQHGNGDARQQPVARRGEAEARRSRRRRTKSQASIRPMPPPTAAPWTRAIDGFGKVVDRLDRGHHARRRRPGA